MTAQGEILVSDRARHQIYRFSPDGKLVGQIGSLGAEPGQFNQPGALSLDGKGNIYVADIGNNRVQVLDPQGRFLRQVGSREEFSPFFSLEDGFDIPLAGVAADREGNIYLALKGAYYDISENELRKYSPEGKLVMKLSSMLEGYYDLVPFTWPGAVTVDSKGTIYLVHGANGGGEGNQDTPGAECPRCRRDPAVWEPRQRERGVNAHSHGGSRRPGRQYLCSRHP